MFKIQLCIGIIFILFKNFSLRFSFGFLYKVFFVVPRNSTNGSEHYFVKHSKILY